MNEILCCNPTIIKNPVRRYRLGSEWKIIYRGHELKYVPSVNRPPVPSDNGMIDYSIKEKDLEFCYYLNEETGETIPLYIVVPCGKCLICRSKKAKEWTTRCICETQMHDEQPWFVTLTYNNPNRPLTGVDKREVQLFMKRLRIRFERKGFSASIRYILAAEYGSNTQLPHYHVIFWNLPKVTDFSYDLNNAMVSSIIQDAWAKKISKSRYDELEDYERYILNDKNGKPLYYERIGFVHVKRAHDNSAGYLAKYIMKEQVIPEGMNKTFVLSSRRHGIGYDYAKEVEYFYKENPHCTTLEICNKFSSTIHTLSIPNYFKNIWNPTGSKYAGNKYPYYRTFRDVYLVLVDMLRFHPFQFNSCDLEIFEELTEQVNKLYPYLTPICWYFDAVRQNEVYKLFSFYRTKEQSVSLVQKTAKRFEDSTTIRVRDYSMMPLWSEDMWCDNYYKYRDMLLYSYEHLINDAPTISQHDENMRLRSIYKGAATQLALNNPRMSVEDIVYQLRKDQEQLRINDMY